MRISKITIYLLDVPLKWKKNNPHGPENSLKLVLVNVETNNGYNGWGETGGRESFFGEGQEDIAITLKNTLAPILINEDPFQIENIIYKMNCATPGHNAAKAALDFALHDLIGRYLNQPVYNLLGGRTHDKLPIGWSLFWKPLPDMLEDASAAVNDGIQALKLKVGSIDPAIDIENLKQIRQLFPNIPIRVDANEGYKRINVLRLLRMMEVYNIQLIEQPLPRWDIAGYTRLCSSIDTPIMVDESVFNAKEAINILEQKACDIINIKPQRLGGLRQSSKVATIADEFGIPCFASGKMSTSLGSAAAAHFAIATKNILFEGEFAVGVRAISDDIVKEPLLIEKGFIELNNAPGLGVDVDMIKINKLLKAPPIVIK